VVFGKAGNAVGETNEKRLGGFDRIQSRLVQIVAILIKSREFELQECKDTVSEEIKLMEPPFKVSDEKVDFRGLAHEIWATAQLLPGEGIEDGVDRIEEILNENFDLGRGVPIDSVDNEGPA